MFKPSTVLIQADVYGGNNNLFDAAQDYLIQSYKKNKNSMQNKFQNEIENEIENDIDNNQVELNKNKKSKILSRSILTRYKEKIEQKNNVDNDRKESLIENKSVVNSDDDNDRSEQKLEILMCTEERIKEEDKKDDFKSVSTELYLIHRYVTILHCNTLYYLSGLVLSLLAVKFCVILFYFPILKPSFYFHFFFFLLAHAFLYYLFISFNLFN
jgi:hypothetical protein